MFVTVNVRYVKLWCNRYLSFVHSFTCNHRPYCIPAIHSAPILNKGFCDIQDSLLLVTNSVIHISMYKYTITPPIVSQT